MSSIKKRLAVKPNTKPFFAYMSNSYFQLKKFTIHQELAAMKVCTDACLFGAFAAAKIENEKLKIESVLDIGAGTGLLSLMLAQKTNSKIDAVEIDTDAARQAKENFEQSAYKERLQLIQADIRTIEPDLKYDLIISNPPFFQHHLKSENLKRNIALHNQSLSFEELLTSADKLLRENGILFVLLPFQAKKAFIGLAKEHRLFVNEEALVRQTEKHNYFRAMLQFQRVETATKTSKIIIKKEGEYSKEFITLLKEYYLFL